MNYVQFGFLVSLLEWYEFAIYNAMVPYGIFGGDNDQSIYISLVIFALSFIIRPLGALFFSSKADRSGAIRLSLGLMTISTFLMAICPGFLWNWRPIWFGICKIIQGFAIGGSYGLAYLSTYEAEIDRPQSLVNYKLALIQTGFTIGPLIGELTVFICRLLTGNIGQLISIIQTNRWIEVLSMPHSIEFLNFGWRLPFLFSSIFGFLMYLYSRQFKSNYVVLPKKNIFAYLMHFIRRQPIKFGAIFAIAGIEMVIFHIFFTYSDIVLNTSQQTAYASFIPNIRFALLSILFPIFGFLTDLLNRLFAHPNKLYGNYIMMFCLNIGIIFASQYAPWQGIRWLIFSCILGATCYGSIVALIFSRFAKTERQVLIGPIFNMTAAFIGSIMPLTSEYIKNSFGISSVGLLALPYSIACLIGLYITWTKSFKIDTVFIESDVPD